MDYKEQISNSYEESLRHLEYSGLAFESQSIV